MGRPGCVGGGGQGVDGERNLNEVAGWPLRKAGGEKMILLFFQLPPPPPSPPSPLSAWAGGVGGWGGWGPSRQGSAGA